MSSLSELLAAIKKSFTVGGETGASSSKPTPRQADSQTKTWEQWLKENGSSSQTEGAVATSPTSEQVLKPEPVTSVDNSRFYRPEAKKAQLDAKRAAAEGQKKMTPRQADAEAKKSGGVTPTANYVSVDSERPSAAKVLGTAEVSNGKALAGSREKARQPREGSRNERNMARQPSPAEANLKGFNASVSRMTSDDQPGGFFKAANDRITNAVKDYGKSGGKSGGKSVKLGVKGKTVDESGESGKIKRNSRGERTPIAPERDEVEFYTMSRKEYNALEPRQKAAVDFNTVLQAAVEKDSVGITAGTEEKEKYDKSYEKIFGEAPAKGTYSPNTLALLEATGLDMNKIHVPVNESAGEVSRSASKIEEALPKTAQKFSEVLTENGDMKPTRVIGSEGQTVSDTTEPITGVKPDIQDFLDYDIVISEDELESFSNIEVLKNATLSTGGKGYSGEPKDVANWNTEATLVAGVEKMRNAIAKEADSSSFQTFSLEISRALSQEASVYGADASNYQLPNHKEVKGFGKTTDERMMADLFSSVAAADTEGISTADIQMMVSGIMEQNGIDPVEFNDYADARLLSAKMNDLPLGKEGKFRSPVEIREILGIQRGRAKR